jgi:hypothetical protein
MRIGWQYILGMANGIVITIAVGITMSRCL